MGCPQTALGSHKKATNMNPWVQTHSGKKFHFLEPHHDEIDIEDIAHALSHQCRFNGHVERFYSVAEHCYHMCLCFSKKEGLAALLHDASEAYISDIPAPLKRFLPDYQKIENSIQNAIYSKWNVLVGKELNDRIESMDKAILLTEKMHVLNKALDWGIEDKVRPIPIRIDFLSQAEVKREFLNLFYSLLRKD